MIEFKIIAVILSEYLHSLGRIKISSAGLIASFFLIFSGVTSFLLGVAIFSSRVLTIILNDPFILLGELFINLSPILIGAGIIVLILDYWIDKKVEVLEAKSISSEIRSENNLVALKALSQARQSGLLESGFLRQLNLERVNLKGGDLSNLDLFRANFDLANLEDCSFSHSVLNEITARRANFKSANLSGANLERADLRESNFKQCNLADANLNSCTLIAANVEGAYADRARFNSADLASTNFENASLVSANFINSNLRGANFTNTDLRGANFTNTDLREVGFENIYFNDATLWPADFDIASKVQGLSEEVET